MNSDGPMEEMESEGEPRERSATCLVEEAPLIDVLIEQLEYLESHAVRGCQPGCADCTRRRHVRNWLLAPFRSLRRSPHPRSAAA